MMRDFRREAYATMTEAVTKSDSVDLASVLWDVAVPVGKALSDADIQSKNFELMLLRLVRAVESGKGTDKAVAQAKDLLGRLGTRSILR